MKHCSGPIHPPGGADLPVEMFSPSAARKQNGYCRPCIAAYSKISNGRRDAAIKAGDPKALASQAKSIAKRTAKIKAALAAGDPVVIAQRRAIGRRQAVKVKAALAAGDLHQRGIKVRTAEKRLANLFGLSFIELIMLRAIQKDRCAISGLMETNQHKDGTRWRLPLDHNHETNKARGLLVHNINVALGLFRENRRWLQYASVYLLASEEEPNDPTAGYRRVQLARALDSALQIKSLGQGEQEHGNS